MFIAENIDSAQRYCSC